MATQCDPGRDGGSQGDRGSRKEGNWPREGSLEEGEPEENIYICQVERGCPGLGLRTKARRGEQPQLIGEAEHEEVWL